ncbi:hypothetical protein GCM10009127_05960 [Alteraurantiacibacter aestuarii]|uniref:Uncharacterized protein n=1 Tax=Alteraurantiacibacter aestuarii TaxID=650004 RepID=A0A844ZNF4_9SPHN|nr:hypothetical protein [Alteraurantiacibacter aestuarii]MXO89074.1 hypothetical protein [Alteraurantiacibacter aestuarii]
MTAQQAMPRPLLWSALFIINMALIAAAHIFDVIEQPVPIILIALNMGLLVPMTRAAKARQELKGAMSPALRVYNRRVLFVMVIYMVAMIGGGNLSHLVADGSPAMWALAIAPLVPLMGMIWTMYRYLQEEDDEYLRHRATTGALFGLALILVLGTIWGFLEMYGLVGHIWSWWVFPVWAIGLGIGMCFQRAKGEEE